MDGSPPTRQPAARVPPAVRVTGMPPAATHPPRIRTWPLVTVGVRLSGSPGLVRHLPQLLGRVCAKHCPERDSQ